MLHRQLLPFKIIIVLFAFLECLDGVDGLNCYGKDMQPLQCEPIQLWCIKFINGSQINRGCANVNDYCYDEDPGCYPEQENEGIKQRWCCCKNDLCNSSIQTGFNFSYFVVVLFSMLFLL